MDQEAEARGPLLSVMWDFDGTLVDTRRKNLAVNRRIVEHVTGKPWKRHRALGDLESYDRAQRGCVNWREFYRLGFGLSEDEVDRAGALWNELQRAEKTPVSVYEGIPEVVRQLSRRTVQGIVSQNSRDNIIEILRVADLADCFRHVIGHEEVEPRRQKPAPDGLVACIEQLNGSSEGVVLYIGDHDTDVLCARNAQAVLDERRLPIRVLSLRVSFDGAPPARGDAAADFEVETPAGILEVVESL